MRYDLTLAGMFSSITSVEESSSYRNECIIVFTRFVSIDRDNAGGYSRFEEAIAMTIDHLYRTVIGDADVVGLNSDHFAILLMSVIDSKVTLATSSCEKKPEIGELRWEGRGAFCQTWISQPW